jgi:hypothetical protein
MQSIPLSVSMRPDPAVDVLNGGHVIEEFIEDGKYSYGVRLGAHTTIVVADGGECYLLGCQSHKI